MKSTKYKTAFSLIELAVVVLLIGLITIVALNGKSLLVKANCVASSFGTKTITDNLDNITALTNNKSSVYENCVNPPASNPVVSFSPSSLTGLKLWFDASDATTIFSDNAGTVAASSNSNVCNWKDKSGNNYNATASGGACPTYKTALQNGLNGVYFNGSNYLTNNSFSSPTANATIFMVSNYSSVLDANNVFSSSSGGWAYYYYNSKLFRYFYNGFIITSSTNVEANIYTIYSIVNNSTATPQVKMMLNNNLVGSSAFGSGHTSYGSFNIGAYGGGYNLNGNVLEIIFYNRTLTDSERNQVECYLGTKWGIAVSGC